VPTNGILVLGQEQDTPGGKFDASQAISGQLTQFGIWDRALSDYDIRKIADAHCQRFNELGYIFQ
jgi:hypothetical protein